MKTGRACARAIFATSLFPALFFGRDFVIESGFRKSCKVKSYGIQFNLTVVSRHFLLRPTPLLNWALQRLIPYTYLPVILSYPESRLGLGFADAGSRKGGARSARRPGLTGRGVEWTGPRMKCLTQKTTAKVSRSSL